MLEILTKQLAGRADLSAAEIQAAVVQLIDEAMAAEIKADFLTALAEKGETPGEIAAFAAGLREKSIPPPIDPGWRASREILDVVGTGGDHLSTFNISTTVAILCAAAGVAVAKHGNRAVTSSVGSADVIEALGIRVDLTPAEAAASLREHQFAFFFAPNFHPAFKHIAHARRICASRGRRTIFNILGPLLNPARPTAMLVGVPRPELCVPMAHALQTLGARRGMVVSGEVAVRSAECEVRKSEDVGQRSEVRDQKSEIGGPKSAVRIYLDELSTLGDSQIAEFYQERGFHTSVLTLAEFPLQPATLADLRGGDKFVNAEIIRRILGGEERGPKRDAVLLNASAALLVAGRAGSLAEGWEVAAETIDGRCAKKKLAELAG